MNVSGVSDDFLRTFRSRSPHTVRVVHLFLILDDNQQIVVTLVARLLIVHPIAARTRTKQDEHVVIDRERRVGKDRSNTLVSAAGRREDD